jgi:hypothetical protein
MQGTVSSGRVGASATERPAREVVIRVDTVDQLFNAPDIDPFSDKPSIVIGQPALPYYVRQELRRGLRDWKGRRLVIQLPGDQLTEEVQRRTPEAIRRFAAAKCGDNEALIRISRWRALVGLGFAIVIAGALVTVLVIALNTVLAALPETAQALFTGIITIFCWATIWNPWDRLVYEWLGPALENRILASVRTVEIEVRAEPAD